MDELLQRLEMKIRDLIHKHESVNLSNVHLYQGKMTLAQEKEALLLKQQQAATQLEGLLAKLKSIGKMP